MTWLQPWAAWFLAGVPVIVLLYFLRLKRRPLTVSTLMFWQRAQRESGRSAFFQKFRHLFSLLLHLLIFLLLLAALARPVFDRGIREGSATVLILDTRARMQATEPDGRTRFDTALRLARDYAGQAGGGRNIALLTLAASPSVVVPFTDDPKLLGDALAKISPTDAAGDLAAAVSLADSLLAARKGSHRIVLLTAGKTGALPKTAGAIVTHTLGTTRDNVAITRFTARALPANPETSEVLLETQNFSAKPARTEIELSLDGRRIDVKPLALAPGERRLDVFASVPRPIRGMRGWLVAKLADDDALALDNVAYAALPQPRINRVLLVSRGNTFLEKLLGVDNSLNFQFVAPEAWQPAMAEKFDAVIFDGFIPPDFDFTAARGNLLFLKATPFSTKAALLEQPVVTDVDSAHPAARLANLQNVTILRAQPLALPEERHGWKFATPLRSAEHPLLLTGERGNQRIATLAFDVLESDLPLRVAFPLLIHNTLGWLAGERPESAPSLVAGETIELPPGGSVSAMPLTAPPRTRSRQPQTSVTGFFQPLQNGFHELAGGKSTGWLAVNTFNAAESDLRGEAGASGSEISDTPSAAKSSASHSAPLATLSGWPPWRWLALAALALLALEWLLFHRRRTE